MSCGLYSDKALNRLTPSELRNQLRETLDAEEKKEKELDEVLKDSSVEQLFHYKLSFSFRGVTKEYTVVAVNKQEARRKLAGLVRLEQEVADAV